MADSSTSKPQPPPCNSFQNNQNNLTTSEAQLEHVFTSENHQDGRVLLQKKLDSMKRRSLEGLETNGAPGGFSTRPKPINSPKDSSQKRIIHLAERHHKNSRTYLKPLKEKPETKKTINSWEDYLLCVIHHFDVDENLTGKSLHINSEELQKFLRTVIGDYPGVSFETDLIYPLHCLYHHLNELRAATTREEFSRDIGDQARGVVDLAEEEFAQALHDGPRLQKDGLITYDLLFTIFKPGTILYSTEHGWDVAFRLSETQYVGGNQPHFAITTTYIDYDGLKFGGRTRPFKILPFLGSVPVQSLEVYPLLCHAGPNDMEDLLLSRGRKFEQYTTATFREYSGKALQDVRPRYYLDERKTISHNVKGRVMVDPLAYLTFNSNFSPLILPSEAIEAMKSAPTPCADDDYNKGCSAEDNSVVTEHMQKSKFLTDEQCIIASPTVCGYVFASKLWVRLSVGNLSPVVFDSSPFALLVLPSRHKEYVQALVQTHLEAKQDNGAAYEKGKGKGSVFVLHGPPGVGKTLTAECVAEFFKRPLFTVSSGDLGTTAPNIEEKLNEFLELASLWDAVLLIDEADVFLEERSQHDLERNAVVSVFLRLLECYTGILFLTTNRIGTFDEAFRSRIHVALRFSPLDAPARKQIWKNGLQELLGNVDLEKLVLHEVNGRQIQNAIKNSKSLASYRKKARLDVSILEEVLEIQQEFDTELRKPNI